MVTIISGSKHFLEVVRGFIAITGEFSLIGKKTRQYYNGIQLQSKLP